MLAGRIYRYCTVRDSMPTLSIPFPIYTAAVVRCPLCSLINMLGFDGKMFDSGMGGFQDLLKTTLGIPKDYSFIFWPLQQALFGERR